MHQSFIRPMLLAGVAVFSLAACGGGSNGNATGQMSLAVADAPVDGATAVVVKFTGVELTGNGNNPVTINFAAPKTIDLLNQSGTASAVLFNQPIPAGTYGQIRLLVVADGDASNSFIDLSDGTRHGLRVPSGTQTGLKLVSGFQVPDSGVVAYTVDFDLRKAITCPPGQAPACILKPALRLVANNEVGNIAGTIEPTLVSDPNCAPGVYLYAGAAVTPDDNGSQSDATDPREPLASKLPVQTVNGLQYQFTFLAPGSYTLALTCGADDDVAEQDDTLTFSQVRTVAVTAGQTATVNLP